MKKEKQYLYLITSLRVDTKNTAEPNNEISYRFEKDIVKFPKKISKISDIIRFEKDFVKASGCISVLSLFFVGVNKIKKGDINTDEEERE